MNRREFLKTTGAIAAGAGTLSTVPLDAAEMPAASARHLPRWRGFNLLAKFVKRRSGNPPFAESDFALLAEWKFNFVRLPLSYRCWSDPDDWLTLREPELKDIDQAVEFGRQHGIHVNLNLHRAPGYCVNSPKEPLALWKDDKALEACTYHWAHFAKRYRGIPNERLSFDLLNEPADIPPETYVRVVKHLVEGIRAEDPHRLIIADGLKWGRDPVYGLVDLGIAQSTRGYDPIQISHYKASWMPGSDKWSVPTWPLRRGEKVVDKNTLRKERIEPWKNLEQKGVGVHVGEWGLSTAPPIKSCWPGCATTWTCGRKPAGAGRYGNCKGPLECSTASARM